MPRGSREEKTRTPSLKPAAPQHRAPRRGGDTRVAQGSQGAGAYDTRYSVSILALTPRRGAPEDAKASLLLQDPV